MENQKSSTINPLLINTSRQFYSRRIMHKSNSNVQLDKVLKILTHQNEKKPFFRTKTEEKQQNRNTFDIQTDNMLKIAKVKIEHVLKKQKNDWRQLYDLFGKFKKSSSQQSIKMNEVNFLLKLEEIIKNCLKQQQINTERKIGRKGMNKKKQGKISLQNIKLYKQNQILKQQLDNLQQKDNYVEMPKNNYCQQLIFHEMDVNYRRITEEQYTQMNRQAFFLKESNNILRDQKKSLQQKINQLKATNQNLCEQILKSRDNSNSFLYKIEMWKNIMCMQNEEIISLKRDMQEIKKEYGDLHRKYQNILKRISKLNANNQTKLNQITSKTVEIFTQQIESFQRIRNNFVVKGHYNVISNIKDTKQITVTYKRYLGLRDTLHNPQGIKKANKDYYRSFKPSFYIYLQKYFEYQGVDKQNFEQININVDLTFLSTIRSILDSKHNEYLLAKNINKQFTSISAFTLSWLSNYKIDQKTHRLQEINTDVCFDTIGSFYARLMSNQLNGNWQVITFRQLLLETLTVDELAFYLKARYKLMKGDSLNGSGTFLQIFYVSYQDALLLIQQQVSDFDYRKKLEQYIKRSIQFQRKKQLIDAHFILRLLLQYYQYVKNKIFSALSKTFFNYNKQKNISMPFQSYLKIYDYNFFEINLAERVQIYQKAFNLGHGIVYLQNIFTVLNQQGYLCIQVEKMFVKQMVYQSEQNIIGNQYQSHKRQIFEQFYQNLSQNSMRKQSSLLGLQQVRLQINQLKQSSCLSYESVFNRFQFLHQICILNLRKMFHSNKIKQTDLITMIPSLFKYYKAVVKLTIQKHQNLQILENFKKKNAARIIFRFYRKKKGIFSKNYLLSSQIYEKSNKFEQIRNEFSSIIDSIKKKYNTASVHQAINQYQQTD